MGEAIALPFDEGTQKKLVYKIRISFGSHTVNCRYYYSEIITEYNTTAPNIFERKTYADHKLATIDLPEYYHSLDNMNKNVPAHLFNNNIRPDIFGYTVFEKRDFDLYQGFLIDYRKLRELYALETADNAVYSCWNKGMENGEYVYIQAVKGIPITDLYLLDIQGDMIFHDGRNYSHLLHQQGIHSYKNGDFWVASHFKFD